MMAHVCSPKSGADPVRRFGFLLVITAIAALGPAAVVRAQLLCGEATRLNQGWTFMLGDVPEAAQPGYDDATWQRVDLPHDWSITARLQPELASCTGYLPGGIGWYRRTVTVPAAEDPGRVFLYFEGVYNRSEVYLNGVRLGHRPNGYVSFYYDATPHVRFGAENTIAVRVDHSRSADSRWYTGSGIYREVHLVRTASVHIAPWGVFARAEEVSRECARLRVDTDVINESERETTVDVRHTLVAPDGSVAATAATALALAPGTSAVAEASMEVRSPHLWSVDDPRLYELRTSVVREGAVVDAATVRTGFRSFSFDPDRGFALNGVPMKMTGVCLHHDAGVLGAAVPREIWRTRLEALKAIGCTAIRTSHNPQAPDFYDLCDELGLLVLNEAFDEWEFPKRKWLRGWNVGEPGFQGSFDFFEAWSERDLADLVRRDRNHPSIFAWSIGNEVDYPNDPYTHPVLDGSAISQPMFGGYKPDQPHARRLGAIAQRLAALVRRLDPSRPVTAALAGVLMSNQTAYPEALDIVGYNYTEDRYAIDHAAYPTRVIYGSENRHGYAEWKAVTDNPHIFGQFLWTGIDYLGEAGRWPSRGSSAGLLDLTGAVKPRGRFREALWSTRPVVHLGTELAREDARVSIDAWPVWNYAPGTRVHVFGYTNAARVRLELNGRTVGDEPRAIDPATGVIAWDLPFEAGDLVAVGLDGQDRETCRTRLQTAGAPVALVVGADRRALARAQIATISLQVVDAEGVPVLDATPEVSCAVEGPARLLGLDAGNMRDVSDYTDATHAAYRGRLVAYVQATGAPGRVRVRLSVPKLSSAEVVLDALGH